MAAWAKTDKVYTFTSLAFLLHSEFITFFLCWKGTPKNKCLWVILLCDLLCDGHWGVALWKAQETKAYYSHESWRESRCTPICEKHQGTASALQVGAEREPGPESKSLYWEAGWIWSTQKKSQEDCFGAFDLPRSLIRRVQIEEVQWGQPYHPEHFGHQLHARSLWRRYWGSQKQNTKFQPVTRQVQRLNNCFFQILFLWCVLFTVLPLYFFKGRKKQHLSGSIIIKRLEKNISIQIFLRYDLEVCMDPLWPLKMYLSRISWFFWVDGS